MATTTTRRMMAIADEVESYGNYVAARSIRMVTQQRDALYFAALPFIQIEEAATAHIGAVRLAEVLSLKNLLEEVRLALMNNQGSPNISFVGNSSSEPGSGDDPL